MDSPYMADWRPCLKNDCLVFLRFGIHKDDWTSGEITDNNLLLKSRYFEIININELSKVTIYKIPEGIDEINFYDLSEDGKHLVFSNGKIFLLNLENYSLERIKVPGSFKDLID